MDEIDKLRKENADLKAILSIVKSSLKSDYEYNVGLIDRLTEKPKNKCINCPHNHAANGCGDS